MWVRQIFKDRETHGEFQRLVHDLRLFDNEYFFRNFRMSPIQFEELLSWVALYIVKSSKRRPTTSPAERLIITLRYLATGDAQFTIASSYRVSPTTVSRIIRETTNVIWDVLCEKGYLSTPSTQEKWVEIAQEFYQLWNFPNCLGAIDGKHVTIQAPNNSGSSYFNYKKSFSIVLLAVCNAKYEFILVDIGEAGRNSDSGIYNSSLIGKAIDENMLNFPGMTTLPGYDQNVSFPYIFVADEGFALKPNMLRPYSRKNAFDASEFIFNYRLSRARRVIENTFGILATRFRIFRRPIIASVENVQSTAKACVALHNYLMKTNNRYFPSSINEIDNSNTEGLCPISRQGSRNSSVIAKNIRDQFKDYFNSNVGAVPWQNNIFNT